MSTNASTSGLPFVFPDLLLPNAEKKIDPDRWATIACDQHTSNPEYWRSVESFVGDSPSTLRLVLPELHLSEGPLDQRLQQIHESMIQYQENGYLTVHPNTAVFVRRELMDGTVRSGLVVAVDLEQYDYHPDVKAAIPASEATIEERLPVRVRIRENAAVETSHVLVLLDDPDQQVIEPLNEKTEELDQLYAAELMLQGGSVAGYAVPENSQAAAGLVENLSHIAEHKKDEPLMVVGDGNHSLAAAKNVWETRKKAGAQEDDPARYALVELVNLYNEGLHFHPIHRILEGVTTSDILDLLLRGLDARFHGFPKGSLSQHLEMEGLNSTEIAVQGQGQSGIVKYEPGRPKLAVALVEELIKDIPDLRIDFIHGEQEVLRIAEERNGTAIVLPPFDRRVLFPMVSRGDLLPRKAFSLGNAQDKRYYFECRAIT